MNCAQMTCSPEQFQCKSTGKCISPDWRCDYDKDCEDGTDEMNCSEYQVSVSCTNYTALKIYTLFLTLLCQICVF